jgi:23S rRNA (guanosine2251-2'-O)-methyltransferase
LDKIAGMAEKRNVPVRRINAEKLKSLAGTDAHQGVAARVGQYPFTGLSTLIGSGNKTRGPFVLLLDHIEDPQNHGAIIRTALCAGMNGIVIPKDRSAGPTPAVSRSSAGALEHMPVCRVTNLVNAIQQLKKDGLWILGLDRMGEMPLYATDLTGPLGIVIGGEDQGIRPLVKKNCDGLISIPQTGGFNSLNASVAAAVVMYEAFRQRRAL